MTKEVIGRECRFALHIPAKHGYRSDLHLIKECIHYSDGSTHSKISFLKDFKRKFWITKPAYRNHKDKKEWEHRDALLEYECTQSELRDRVANALDMTYSTDHLKKLTLSPYVYGTDMTSSSLIKKAYMQKWPSLKTPYNVGFLDIETRPLGKKMTEIIMITVVCKDVVYTAVLSDVVKGVGVLDILVDRAMSKYLPQYEGKLKCKIVECKTEIEMIQRAFSVIHQLNPDILAIWNMDYDVPRILESIERAGYDPKDVLSHPDIPEDMRYCKYKQGKSKKITASGKIIPINIADRWHTLYLTAGFYVLDAMCVYRQIRSDNGERSSYSLDSVLQDELGTRKLKFSEADDYKGLKWHLFMQEHYIIEYIIYNRYDCLSMQELETKNSDLSMTIPDFAGITDFDRYNSLPKKIVDAMYCYLEPEGLVNGTTGFADKKIPFDAEEASLEEEEIETDKTLSLAGWIVTLQAELQVGGLPIALDFPNVNTNLRGMVYDSDAVSAYPNGISTMNVSKETTKREVIRIDGIPEEVFRLQNMNLFSGPVNAVEYCTNMFNFPPLSKLVDLYKKTN